MFLAYGAKVVADGRISEDVHDVEERVREDEPSASKQNEASDCSSSRTRSATPETASAILQTALESFKLFPRIHVGRCRGSR